MTKYVFMVLMFVGTLAHAELVKENIVYKQGDVALEGYLVYDNANTNPRGGVLVVHEWMGLNDFAKNRADQLAQLGYVAFAADIYGQGVRPNTVEEAGKTAGMYKADRLLLRQRVLAGLSELIKQPLVDPRQVAAIGYCFGGTTVLELARSGTLLKGVVSFHGGLGKGDVGHEKIVTPILVLHGADDPFVPSAEVADFEQEMTEAQATYTLVQYPGAVHGFTNPNNQGTIPGALYNKEADEKSWIAMQEFFKTIGL